MTYQYAERARRPGQDRLAEGFSRLLVQRLQQLLELALVDAEWHRLAPHRHVAQVAGGPRDSPG